MPYLSHNYRFETKSRTKSLAESFIFVIIATIAIFFTLFILGWISASAAEALEKSMFVEQHKFMVQIEGTPEDMGELEIFLN